MTDVCFLGVAYDKCFFLGVAYVTDRMYGNCTAKKIELTFDDRNVDRNHVSMRNPAQFFYFDVINYTYEGVVSLMIVCEKS